MGWRHQDYHFSQNVRQLSPNVRVSFSIDVPCWTSKSLYSPIKSRDRIAVPYVCVTTDMACQSMDDFDLLLAVLRVDRSALSHCTRAALFSHQSRRLHSGAIQIVSVGARRMQSSVRMEGWIMHMQCCKIRVAEGRFWLLLK